MTNYWHIVVILCATAVLIGGLTAWTAYKNGELGTLLGTTETIDNVEIPLAIDDTYNTNNEPTTPKNMANPRATFKTNQGDITLELYQDSMPITVGNFLKLAEDGFYNNTKFHRVIDGFMIQGGDPNSKGNDTRIYGTGGPGYTIQDEFVPGLSNVRGTIAMANTGQPNSGGSQFFINLVDNTGLDYDKPPMTSSHPVFGRVLEGMDVVDKIGKLDTDARDLPTDPVIISSIEISE